MPLVFSRDEIREFLSEMGYGDLNDEDLAKFIDDLRKLITTESKQRRRRRLGHTGHTRSDFSTTDESNSTKDSEGANMTQSRPDSDSQPRLLFTPKSKLAKHKPRNAEESSDFATTSADLTSDSNPRSSSLESKRQQISGTSGDSYVKSSSGSSQTSVPSAPLIELSSAKNAGRTEADGRSRAQSQKKSAPRPSSATQVPSRDSKENEENSGTASCTDDSLADADLLCLMEHILKNDMQSKGAASGDTESSKRKIEIPMKIRRDPVALYHWYKTFWDKQKPPGEDRHMQLRWNVRAGTVGKYPCDPDGVPINYLNPVKPKKKVHAF